MELPHEPAVILRSYILKRIEEKGLKQVDLCLLTLFAIAKMWKQSKSINK